MRRLTLVVAAVLVLAVSLRVPAQQPGQFSPLDLVGTWTLDSAEPGGTAAKYRLPPSLHRGLIGLTQVQNSSGFGRLLVVS